MSVKNRLAIQPRNNQGGVRAGGSIEVTQINLKTVCQILPQSTQSYAKGFEEWGSHYLSHLIEVLFRRARRVLSVKNRLAIQPRYNRGGVGLVEVLRLLKVTSILWHLILPQSTQSYAKGFEEWGPHYLSHLEEVFFRSARRVDLSSILDTIEEEWGIFKLLMPIPILSTIVRF
uniref:hypothetical protein n=1 Tax=Roseivirga sp. TaxID=1964215 RepID=UPI0040470896